MITDFYHQAWLSAMMYKKDLWSRPYIGVLGAQNDHYFYYVDNSRLVFSNWAPHKPNGDMSDRRCVVMQYTPTDDSNKGERLLAF